MGLRVERTDGKPDPGLQIGNVRFSTNRFTPTDSQARAGRRLLGGFVGVGLLVLVVAIVVMVIIIR